MVEKNDIHQGSSCRKFVCNICCISSLIRKNKTDYNLKDHSISNENLKIGKVKSGFMGTNTKERDTN